MSTKKSVSSNNGFFGFCVSDWIQVVTKSDKEAGKIFKKALEDLATGNVPEDSPAYPMYKRTQEYRERQRQRIADYWKRQRAATNGNNVDESTNSLPAVPTVPAKPEAGNYAYRGEFNNVNLSQAQYNALLQKFGNKTACDRAIDSLSARIENGEEAPRNHYAVLVKWSAYRSDRQAEKENAPHFETVSEHNMRVLAEGKKWIHEHFGENANGT